MPDEVSGTAYLWWAIVRPAEFPVRMPNDPDRYAAMLYDTLHRADGLGVREIVVEPVPPGSDWDGIRDRLARASTV